MSATLTDPKAATAADLAALLADGEAPVAEVLEQVPELVLAQAWARGDVEFGRAAHCVTGRPGVPESMPTLVIEDGTTWTGPKKPTHQRFRQLYEDARRLPDCRLYKQYVKETTREGDVWKTVEIERGEAAALLAPRVRLTDKGLAGAQAA